MMIRLLIFLASLFLFGACASSDSAPASRAEGIVAEIHNPSSRKVLVACHRGDWRNYPENSLAAIESVIGMGADIVEIDLALTSDSVLVVCARSISTMSAPMPITDSMAAREFSG